MTASNSTAEQAVNHTPAPWSVEQHTDNGHVEALVRLSDGRTLAHFGRAEEIGIGLANARLIAAAPDLLAACKFLVSILDVARPVDAPSPIVAIKAAIAKAEGRS